ncbi:protein OBERON 2 isoform X2 [Cryptomeria japonica]|uniref:protein OBERON 2 isoform X2 n=1 Tax=Cryptomeria japonica TaxID=3369 RepID=UPI0027DA2881|nr:protein OBERON 2 isoform X2 [Cryptomeria japonica]
MPNMTNASGVSENTMAITVVESNGTPSKATSVEIEASESPPLKTGSETLLKYLKCFREIQSPENLPAVLPKTKGEGLPYAPEGFPGPEDKWIWKVGKRTNSKGYLNDRMLILPKSLQKGQKKILFTSKGAVEKYMRKFFPEVDLQTFFASFVWPMRLAVQPKNNGGEEMIGSSAKRLRNSDISVHGRTPGMRVCNAGNAKCCLETGKGKFSKSMDCDICCVEHGFCRECSCILCGKCVDHDLDEYYFIQCQEKLSEEFICGHVAHMECAIICQTGGVVRSIGLDVEYYCRRCDKKTDLLKHVLGLITTPGSGKLRSDVEKSLNLALRLIQGTQQARCKSLENFILKGVKKSGAELQDIFGDAQYNSGTVNAGEILHQANSPVCTIGDMNEGSEVISKSLFSSSIRRSCRLQTRSSTPDVFSKKESAYIFDQFHQKESISEDISTTSDLQNIPAKFRILEFENKIYQALNILRQSQEREYKIAQEKLFAQRDLVLALFQQVDEANSKYKKNTASIEKAAQKEHEKLVHMLGIADGFGSTSTGFLNGSLQ